MNFLRLPDILLSVLFEDEDILAIDKPYGFNAHTNDSKIEHSDFIQDGLIEIYEKQWGRKLHIIHRLDQTTTGVMIFGKSVDSAKKYAEYFFNREVKKTYMFVTKKKSEKKSFTINQQIIHKAKELDAETDLAFVKKSANFELWQANPHTGRNHQIRIHAKAAGISILGDTKYNGHNYAFLCLHNCRIEFPNGIVILSKMPAYFEDLTILDDVVLARAYFEADRRQRLFAKADKGQCFRLSHNDSDFTIDQFGETIALTWFKERWTEADAKKFSAFAKTLTKELVVQKVHTETKTTTWIAAEGDLQYEIRGDAGQVSGLVLSQRLQRQWILKNSENKSVLNLFSQTATASLAAALGKASQVTVVETSKKYLEWAKKNFELNKLANESFKFLNRDSLTYLEQCKTKGITFDLIICEAPAFFRRERSVFKIENNLEELIKNCLQCLADKGQILFSTSFDALFIDDIRKTIVKVQKDLRIDKLEINCILPSLDYELPDEKIGLKSFLIGKI
ncbi:MAG: pseudouridine synthase [Bdellovibrionota bacterium]